MKILLFSAYHILGVIWKVIYHCEWFCFVLVAFVRKSNRQGSTGNHRCHGGRGGSIPATEINYAEEYIKDQENQCAKGILFCCQFFHKKTSLKIQDAVVFSEISFVISS